jgi:hypothetical protein
VESGTDDESPGHLVHIGLGRDVHPLVRFASLMLRAEAAGGTLNTTFQGTTPRFRPAGSNQARPERSDGRLRLEPTRPVAASRGPSLS